MNASLFSLALMDGVSYAALLFLVALGLTLIFGVMNILNIAHGSLYAWGGYAAATMGLAIVKFGVPNWLALPSLFVAAIIVGVVLGSILEIGLLRRILDKDPILQLLVTFAAFMVLEDLQRMIWGGQPYFVSDIVTQLGTISVAGVTYTRYQLLVLPVVAVVCFLGLRWFLGRTALGRQITAVTHHREVATAMGVNASRVSLLTIVIGALVGLFMVRYRGIFFGMLNLAFSMVLFSVLGKFGGVTGGTDGLRFDRPTLGFVHLERDAFETALLGVALLCALLAGLLVQRYFRSVPGQALAAIKTNETRLEYLGISAKRVFWGGYVLAAALCGLGGTLFALTQGLVTPEMGYWVRSGEIVFIAILGGSGHAVGAFIGAFVFEFVKLYVAAWLTGSWQLVLGLILLFMVFAAPTGIFGLIERRLRPAGAGDRA